ncbi:hypothetical protein I553_3561 [Mycobacterium xenopi 4042]|uniref:Uncharacterized protein n=1 Tax=Mycobacterium xenopi 4042 TaxID=1299334 RepID=X8AKZ2_MYCXE|nr:hypothetical protein I553_3561 [Mycobacterium xenopi 4042]
MMAWRARRAWRAHDVAVLLWRLCIEHRRSLAVRAGRLVDTQPSALRADVDGTECLTTAPVSRNAGMGYADDPHWPATGVRRMNAAAQCAGCRWPG